MGQLDNKVAVITGGSSGIDVVVANAGTAEVAMLEQVTDEHFDLHFNTNVRSTLNTVRKALPLLTDGASVVLVSSVSGSGGTAGYGVYNASKAAVRSFARTWANELKGRKIRVNALSPGIVDTAGIEDALVAAGMFGRQVSVSQVGGASTTGTATTAEPIRSVALSATVTISLLSIRRRRSNIAPLPPAHDWIHSHTWERSHVLSTSPAFTN